MIQTIPKGIGKVNLNINSKVKIFEIEAIARETKKGGFLQGTYEA